MRFFPAQRQGSQTQGLWYQRARVYLRVVCMRTSSSVRRAALCAASVSSWGSASEDCAPSAELLLLVGHDFPDSEALLATRGAHLPEAETLYVGRWKVGVRNHWLEWELGGDSRAPG